MDERVDALFALPPQEFTAARDELVRRLRAAGQREASIEVAGLRRPTLAAWAVNQAVRRDASALAALVDSGREVHRAQRRALSGMRQPGILEANRRRRDEIGRLTDAAAEVLARAGTDPGPHRADIAATFEAASVDQEAAEQVAAGRLSRTLPAPAAFGDVVGFTLVDQEADPPPAATVDQREAPQLRAAAQAVARARKRAEEARAQAEESRARAAAEQQQAAAAEDAAEQARRQADRLRRQADALAASAARSQRAAGEAQRQASRRAQELEEAETRLRRLEA